MRSPSQLLRASKVGNIQLPREPDPPNDLILHPACTLHLSRDGTHGEIWAIPILRP